MTISTFAARVSAVAAAVFLLTAAPATAVSKPSAPRSPSATPGNAAVTVRWAAPATSGGAAIDHYAVQRYYGGGWHTVRTTAGTARSWTNTGLANGTSYSFRVQAHNRIGWGPASTTVRATPRTTPGAPRYADLTRADSSATVTWQTPGSTGGAPIDRYLVERSVDGATFGSGISTTQLQSVLTGLTPGTRYWFRIRAHNVAGYGPPTGIGPLDAITAPADPVAVGIDNSHVPALGELYVNWGVDIVVGAPITRFDVEYQGGSVLGWVDGPSPSLPEAKLTDLEVGEEYVVRVRACNQVGCSGWSTSGTLIPAPNPPSAPQNLTPLQTQAGASIAWNAPANDGGAAIDQYQIQVAQDDQGTTLHAEIFTTSTEASSTGLTAGQMYWFRGRAHNHNGSWGAWTAWVPLYIDFLPAPD